MTQHNGKITGQAAVGVAPCQTQTQSQSQSGTSDGAPEKGGSSVSKRKEKISVAIRTFILFAGLAVGWAGAAWAGASTTTLASGTNPSVAGQAVVLTATVTGTSPTGTVTFMDGSTTLGTGTLDGTGTGTLSYAFNTVGTHSLTAVYGGDTNNASSTSAAVSQTVNVASTTTALSSSTTTPVVCQPVTLTATVTGGAPTGTVTFYQGTTALGTGTLDASGVATLTTVFSGPATGSPKGYTATYGGDANNSGSTSPSISMTLATAPSTTTFVTSPNPAVAGQTITMTATVTGTTCHPPSGNVSFYRNNWNTLLGSATLSQTGPDTSTATFTYTFPANWSGSNLMSAGFGGDSYNGQSSSSTVTQTVNKATTTTTLTPSVNPSEVGQTITLTATINNGYLPTGTVTFYDGTTNLGATTVYNGAATLNHAFTTQGTHNLTATYSGDNANTASTSSAVSHTVNIATSITALTSSLNPAAPNQTVTLTATIAGYQPTGTVTFYDGTTSLGTSAVSGGVATLSQTFASLGAHSLTASYSGDTNNTASTSTALSQNTAKVATATALTASPNPAAPNQAVTLTATVTGSLPSGTVTFMDGSTTLGTGTVDGTGTATLSYAFTATGTHLLTANYAGDGSNNPSTSTLVAEGVTNAMTVYYIQPDQLNTPRTVTDTAGNVVWQWDNQDPFGNNVPNENPSNQGTFHFNLRFPGQYFDPETGLAYNVNRDYDASIGRYVESDPSGLWGGINTYGYVDGNPISAIDPDGLMCFNFDKFADQVRDNRANNAWTLGSLFSMEAVGTMPKTAGEISGSIGPRENISPITSQLSRWSGRFGTRALRVLGRTAVGMAAGVVATGAVVFEGFYDIGVMGKAAVDATSSSDCGCNAGK